MLFCDPIYFAVLLPVVAFLYWRVIVLKRFSLAIPILIIASVVFYITWSWKFFLLLGFSASVNFLIGRQLLTHYKPRFYLWIGVLFNLCLLGYFKYFNFFVDNCNVFFSTNLQIAKIVLPLGISFYTFQQLAYIVDAYKHQVQPCGFWRYVLFVIYFPQLVAGPIVHYQEMMPQFGAQKCVRWDLIWEGLFIFICGLFKKIMIADQLGRFVQDGYAHVDQLGIVSAWLISLSYTFQLYFDFSGYADMAIGSGLFFGIRLPENFNSPYKALDIQDFWRRWHMTLSAWLKNYVYFSLGGSRCSMARTCINLFLTFFVGGIWHGAGWTFIVWGTMHGLAAVIHRLCLKAGLHLNKCFAWLITFNFINIAWIFFRADSVHDAGRLIKKMFDVSCLTDVRVGMPLEDVKMILNGSLFTGNRCLKYLIVIVCVMAFCLLFKNTKKFFERWGSPNKFKTFILSGIFWWVIIRIASNANQVEFLYWQF